MNLTPGLPEPSLGERLAALSPGHKALLLARLKARQEPGPAAGGIPRLARDGRDFPLSFAQERLYFLEQFAPGNPFYNIHAGLRLPFMPDPQLLERCLNAILLRHEALRSAFVGEEAGQARQRILPELHLPLALHDLRAVAGDEREAALARLAAGEAGRGFDLAAPPLLRAVLVCLGAAESALLLTMHHIVSDGWSLDVLFRELSELYPAFAAGRPPTLAPLPIQYADYAVWQRGWLEGGALESQIGYWRRHLQDLPTLELPTDHPRPARPGQRGAHHPVRIPAPLGAQLRQLARREQTTVFMVLLAVFEVLLMRHTGQTDLVVGSYSANRGRAETRDLIGFFINTLVLRVGLAGEPDFGEVLRRVRAVAQDAYAHQDVPFATLVQALHPARDLSRNPLFQVVFHVLNEMGSAPPEAGAAPPDAVEVLDSGHRVALFDLVFELRDEAGGGFAGGITYDAGLFTPGRIERLAGHYLTLLGHALAGRPGPVARWPILAAAEEARLLEAGQGARHAVDLHRGVVRRFMDQAARTPDGVAFACGPARLSYAELECQANRLAHHLLALGAGPETPVGLLLPRSLAALIGVLAIFKSGACYVPLDPAWPAARLALMAARVGLPLILSDTAGAAALPAGSARRVLLDRDGGAIAGRPATPPPVPEVGPEGLAYILFTSGSTGTPKAVGGTHRQLLNRLDWMARAHPFAPGEVACHKTAPGFIDALWEVFGALLQGIPTEVLPDALLADHEAFVGRLAASGVSRIWLVPALLRALLDEMPELARQLPRLRFWVSTGEVLPAELYRRFRARLPAATLYNLYGSSEVWDVTWHQPEPADDGPAERIPIGRPIDNLQAYVLDPARQLVPIGVVGELFVGGAGLPRSYLGEDGPPCCVPDPFADAPDARLYRSGDLVRWREDGELEFIGRADQQLKIRGYRIEPGEIEAQLESHPAVRQAVISPVEEGAGAAGGLQLAVHLVFREGQEAEPDSLRPWLAARLPEPMIPARWFARERLPLTASGKLDRRALAHLARAGAAARARPRVAPGTPLEEALAAVWQDVLGGEAPGTDQHFFNDLGGHSLLATRAVARIRERLGVALSLRQFFDQPTIAALAREIAARPAAVAAPPAAAIVRQSRASHAISAGEAEALRGGRGSRP